MPPLYGCHDQFYQDEEVCRHTEQPPPRLVLPMVEEHSGGKLDAMLFDKEVVSVGATPVATIVG